MRCSIEREMLWYPVDAPVSFQQSQQSPTHTPEQSLTAVSLQESWPLLCQARYFTLHAPVGEHDKLASRQAAQACFPARQHFLINSHIRT